MEKIKSFDRKYCKVIQLQNTGFIIGMYSLDAFCYDFLATFLWRHVNYSTLILLGGIQGELLKGHLLHSMMDRIMRALQ